MDSIRLHALLYKITTDYNIQKIRAVNNSQADKAGKIRSSLANIYTKTPDEYRRDNYVILRAPAGGQRQFFSRKNGDEEPPIAEKYLTVNNLKLI